MLSSGSSSNLSTCGSVAAVLVSSASTARKSSVSLARFAIAMLLNHIADNRRPGRRWLGLLGAEFPQGTDLSENFRIDAVHALQGPGERLTRTARLFDFIKTEMVRGRTLEFAGQRHGIAQAHPAVS